MARSTSLSLRVLRVFCPRHDGQLRCDVLEKFPPEPSRHEAGDVEDRLQLLIGPSGVMAKEARPAAPGRGQPSSKNLGDIGNRRTAWKRLAHA